MKLKKQPLTLEEKVELALEEPKPFTVFDQLRAVYDRDSVGRFFDGITSPLLDDFDES